MNELPIYKISIDDIFEEGGLDYVSLVADPAIQMKGLAFSSIEDLFTFKFNADKQIIAGPALIPDKLIYREDPDLGQFYVVFDANTIEKLVAKFNKTPKEFKVNVDHSSVVPSAYIFSNWIITDSSNDKSNSYGFSLPEGTWFCEVKIDDTEFWNTEVKTNSKFGFSVEGLFGLKLNNNKIQKQEEMTNKLKFAEAKLADGTTVYASSIEVGAEVYVIDENLDKVPVFDGEHELADGTVIATVDGKITEVKSKEEAMTEVTPEIEVEAAEEVVIEPVAEAVPAIDEAKVMELVQPKFDELYSMIAELKTMIETAEIEDEVMDMKETKLSKTQTVLAMVNQLKK
jgi:uncharacterized Zn finger protein (UPF0148 family)